MASYTNTVTLPRFVTVPLAAFGPAARVRSVRSGPSDDPGIAWRNPAQWFASWGPAARLPAHTAYHNGASITGLRPGRYVARVVLANPRKYKGRGAKVTFTVP